MADKTRYCSECGREVGARRFCPFCGAAAGHDRENVATGSTSGSEGTVIVGRGTESHGTVVVGKARAGSSSDTVLVGDESSLSARVSKAAASRESVADEEPGGETAVRSFGRYRVVREVGRGAMGVVYLARDDKINRNVAIKALHLSPGLSDSERKQVSARFEREAKAAGMLSHPNIVTVHDVGEEEGAPYIAMEYLQGATLTEIASEGPLTIKQAAGIITQVLAALEYAHAHDVVHRDIKPDNVFMLPDGMVKVADFGIARIASDSTMTQVGQVMGTPGYMSPEQVKGETVGPPSDIFSAGVLLYELLTGTAAFGSTSATSIMYKIVHEEPRPPHLVNPGVPPDLEAVIAKATAKNPSERYATAASMKSDVESGKAPPLASSAVSHDGTILRSGPVAMPVLAPGAVLAGASPKEAKNRTVMWGVIGGAGALVIIGVVLGVLLLIGGGVSLKILSPKTGESLSSANVRVELDVKNSDEVARIDLYLDGTKQKTLEGQAASADLQAGRAGTHELKATAYDDNGAVLAEASSSFKTTSGSTGGPGDFKADFAARVNDANNLNNQIASYATRINNEVNFNAFSVPPGLMSEVQNLYNTVQGLATSTQGLSAPADMTDLQSQLLQFSEYLRVRADAMVRGLQAVGSGGNYKAEFDRGGAAKSSFDTGWPAFLSNARSRGIGI